ncbi:hypothetical protein [Butyrivibrio sp. VCD2006]|uniref:hypothetical protein n=1 Tax=Butyrivibrio sp. VCD2006 TaxID=1280664 RepID=UPI000410872F|nr:hypothetical protein [Butyrivibrio sp. VCD2006]
MKNTEIMLDVIGEIDEKLIPDISETPKKRGILSFYITAVLCATAILAIAIGIPSLRKHENKASIYAFLDRAEISEIVKGTDPMNTNISFGDMGAGEIMAEDISKLDEVSPWSEDANITEMPVLRNDAFVDDEGILGGMQLFLDEEQMISIAQNAAKALSLEVTQLDVAKATDNVEIADPEKEKEIKNRIYSVDATCADNTTITVYGDGTVRIIFEGKTIPSKYNFSYNNTTDAEAAEVLDYLMTEYAGLTGFKNPKAYSCVEKGFEGEDDRSYCIYDSADDIRESILNHDLAYATFYPDENGNLFCIWINNAFCSSTYVGDYPIITVDEATEKLINGAYYSSIPDDEYFKKGELSADDIAMVQLKYRSAGEKYYVPYYEFYVELDPEISEEGFEIPDGTKLYGLLYVPAVAEEYLDVLDNATMVYQ